ncbi:MAG: hypothetical protein JW819_10410 [Candidatus Krumholzibacteriota bacterium]|nr:hypothetical protein [Candidatus Krumholzibacteriota bacterium]
MDRHARRLALAAALLLAALPALAQDLVLGNYLEGDLAFHYQQWPFGSYSGDFAAAGAVYDSLAWGATQFESCGGRLEVVADTTVAWGYGAVLRPDETVDLAAVFIRSIGVPQPGGHPVDTVDLMAGMLFFDGVANFSVPTDPGDLMEWLASLDADHTFFGTTGTIYVSAVTDSSFTGTFSGTMTDPTSLMIISVTGGVFHFAGEPTGTAAPPPAPALSWHGAWPNPFNPATRLGFALAAPGPVRVALHDAAGRLVTVLHEGRLGAGEHHLDWDGTDARGRALPAGLYLYRIRTAAGAAGGKLLLLP